MLELVSQLAGALSPANHKGLYQAEGDFHRDIYLYIVERTNKAEVRPEEQSEKA